MTIAPETVLENTRAAIRNYGSMFDGNPVGTNPEIAAALNGDNPKGVKFLDPEKAFAQALQLLNEGADIIDIGGESTRPGAKVSGSGPTKKGEPPKIVSEKEELERVLPVIQRIKQERPKAVISTDTYKANVARAAVEAGAEIVNDVSAFRWESARCIGCPA